MPDCYNQINTLSDTEVEAIANVLEIRAADIQQQRMLKSYLREIPFPKNAKILEIGTGTGAVSRHIAQQNPTSCVIGIDPSALLINKAKTLSKQVFNLEFLHGFAHELPFEDNSFDVVIFHTVLSHLSAPENALSEAYRVLNTGGTLAIFDGDYASTTLGTGDLDPLQLCAAAFREHYIDNSWIGRLVPHMVQQAGFKTLNYRSHGYTESDNPSYMLTIVDRGADALIKSQQIGPELGNSLKQEARRRVKHQRFFGHISYTSLIARKEPVVSWKEHPAKPDSASVTLTHNALGTAVVAIKPIRANEFIAGFYGEVFWAEKASQLPTTVKNHAIQFASNLWRDASPGGIARNINHSCTPNCGISGLFDVIAMRDIAVGEELFFDYGMTENSDWVVPGGRCLCSSESCRGKILPYRELPEDIRHYYKPFISRWLYNH